MNDDERLQSERHIYNNRKGALETIHERMRPFINSLLITIYVLLIFNIYI